MVQADHGRLGEAGAEGVGGAVMLAVEAKELGVMVLAAAGKDDVADLLVAPIT